MIDVKALLKEESSLSDHNPEIIQQIYESVKESRPEGVLRLHEFAYDTLIISILADYCCYLIAINVQETYTRRRVRLFYGISHYGYHGVKIDRHKVFWVANSIPDGERKHELGVRCCDLDLERELLDDRTWQTFSTRGQDCSSDFAVLDGWYFAVHNGCPIEMGGSEIDQDYYYYFRLPASQCFIAAPETAESSILPLTRDLQVVRIPRFASATGYDSAGRGPSWRISLERCEAMTKLINHWMIEAQ